VRRLSIPLLVFSHQTFFHPFSLEKLDLAYGSIIERKSSVKKDRENHPRIEGMGATELAVSFWGETVRMHPKRTLSI